MGTSRPLPKRRRLREHFSGIQHVLLVSLLMSLAAVTIVSLVLFWPLFAPGKSTPSPTPTALVVASPVPSPLRSPTPLSTPSPTSTATSSPSPVLSPSPTLVPSPTPSPAPGVLGYPLYSGNPRLPEIALTFDDGPNVTATPQILAILQRYRVPATFFLVGQQAAHYPALVTQEAQQGVVIGNHTWSHPNLITLSPEQVRAQLESCSAEISQDAEVTPVLFRPPGGNFTVQTQAIAASLGLSTILWNVDPKDWSRPGAEVIIQRVLAATHNGAIILLHDGGGDRSQTVAALPAIIATLQQRGFQFVTLPRMIEHLPPGGTGPAPIFLE